MEDQKLNIIDRDAEEEDNLVKYERPLAYVEYHETSSVEKVLRGVVVAHDDGYLTIETLTCDNQRETYHFSPSDSHGIEYEVFYKGSHIGNVLEDDVFYTENGMDHLVG